MLRLLLLLSLICCAWAQPATISPAVFTGTGLNDAVSGGKPTGPAANYIFSITIQATGSPDTFEWSVNGGSLHTGIHITGVAQALSQGVTITFAATTGHTLGDLWTITDTANSSLNTSDFINNGIGAVFRSAQSKARETVSIADFFPSGVTCDGTTDLTSYIQSALNSNPTVLNTVLGNCLTGPVVVPTAMTLNVISGSTLLLKASSSGDLLTLAAAGTLVTGGGTLDGNAANQSATVTYPGMGTVRITTDNVTISGGLTVQNGYQYGIWGWVALNENQNIAFDRQNITITGTTIIEPVSAFNPSGISGNVAHSTFSNNHIIAPGDGIGGLFLPHDNVIAGNIISTGRIGVELFAGSSCSGSAGCTGYEALGYNNTVSHNSIFVDPATFTGTGDFAMGISFGGETGCLSSGNVITLNPTYAGPNVYAGHEIASGNPVNGASNNNVISGGSITGAFPTGISLDTSFSNVITGVNINNTFSPPSQSVAHNYGAMHMLGPQNFGMTSSAQSVTGNVISDMTISVTSWMPCYSWQPLSALGINYNNIIGGSCTGDGTIGGSGVTMNQYLGSTPPGPAIGNTVSHIAFNNLDTGVLNNPSNPVTSSYVYGHTFAGVNTNYGGSPSGYLISPLDARQPVVVFTPTAIGWYRIVASANASIGGIVRILSGSYDNAITDIEFQYDMPGFGANLNEQIGYITQLRYSDYNTGVVSQARVSNDGGANVYLDIYVSTATTPKPLTLEFVGGNLNLPTSVITAPVVGATLSSMHVYALTFGGGINTTGNITAPFLIGEPQVPSYTFLALPAVLPPPGYGGIIFCSDCTIASPCAGGGTGAYAFENNFLWNCPF